MTYGSIVNPSVVVPNNDMFGSNGMGFILGLLFVTGAWMRWNNRNKWYCCR